MGNGVRRLFVGYSRNRTRRMKRGTKTIPKKAFLSNNGSTYVPDKMVGGIFYTAKALLLVK